MELSTLYIFFLALLFLILLLGISVSFVTLMESLPAFKKAARQRHYQEILRRLVYRYRLSQMLHFIGIRVEDFVSRVPSPEVRKHVFRCKRCPNVETCDACLRDGKFMSDMHFCPNYQSLMAYSRFMPEAE
ncbi:MAG: DUF6455 family protein [Gammaproteobacteria bacterium]|jgi:hypothetical protein